MNNFLWLTLLKFITLWVYFLAIYTSVFVYLSIAKPRFSPYSRPTGTDSSAG